MIKKLAIILLLIIFCCDVTANDKEIKYNVLYLSFCSVDTNFIPFFSLPAHKNLKTNLPNLTHLFEQSFLFKNAYSDFSWSTARRFIFLNSWRKKYGLNNKWHEAIQDWNDGVSKATLIRIPFKEDFLNQFNDFYTEDRLVEPFEKINEIFDQIQKRRKENHLGNIWMIHFKLMHYPYLSNYFLKRPELLSKNFDKTERELLSKYLNNPKLYPDKYPFFQILFGDSAFKNVFINKNGQYVSYLTNIDSVNKWKKSKDYKIDVSILIKSYQLRLQELDRLIGELFKRYKGIEDNTVLVVGGDHGETVFEHDYLSHGYTPYDEVIKFFHAIHFPFQKNKFLINTQFSQSSLGEMIENIVKGSFSYNNMEKLDSGNPSKGSEVFSFSCAGDVD
jgi:hypothetical protein